MVLITICFSVTSWYKKGKIIYFLWIHENKAVVAVVFETNGSWIDHWFLGDEYKT